MTEKKYLSLNEELRRAAEIQRRQTVGVIRELSNNLVAKWRTRRENEALALERRMRPRLTRIWNV